MGGISLRKLTDNIPLSMSLKIVAVLFADIFIRRIVPLEFWQINTRDFIQKWYDNEIISFVQWFSMLWNSTNYELIVNTILVVIIIIFLFRFRYKKAENFQFTQRTLIIALLCALASAIGSFYILRFDTLYYGVSWQWRVLQMTRTLIIVAFFEELIYRGFITTELFRLKSYGLKTPVAIAISAIIFGFIHVQGSITRVLDGFPPSFTWESAERFFSTAAIGVSMSVIFYYTKDIVSLICIHTANNILYDLYLIILYANGGELRFRSVWFTISAISFYFCYPVYLIYKAGKKPKTEYGC